ncbi:SpoIVB peptidase [Dysosmobacter sp.]|uniref:SpoIVB peptidase n=1 Tax=Dysosmobacter sp. TaxID=2591382 RepID=UPI002A887958|nr:SpoIVB peptidase [Dysosmobacter sp.]MDY3281056.1 SpoIVB peptidase [Dysosmobacter sp.]
MHERFQTAKKWLRSCGVACFGLLLALSLATGQAAAAGQESPRMLTPVGHTMGIKLFSRGVLVVGLTPGKTPARSGGLETGDVILQCNGTAVTSSEQFQTLLRSAGGESLSLQVGRNSDRTTVTVQPEQNEQGDWAIGAWIRDSMAGIGTMTFCDPETGTFGALGHGITDTDTNQLMPFASGSILPSTVKAVRRGEAGAAGELRGDFDLTTQLGTLSANTGCGIFGTVEAPEFLETLGPALPVAEKSEVRSGPAVILSNVEGDTVKEYAVEITKLSPGANDPRELLVTVTDPELLAATGGIVQGQSGSPILQDGKLVGAVTHVLLNDPARGYGIFIETMLNAAE